MNCCLGITLRPERNVTPSDRREVVRRTVTILTYTQQNKTATSNRDDGRVLLVAGAGLKTYFTSPVRVSLKAA